MLIYIGARYGRKAEALRLAERLIELGHDITSTWIRQVEDEMLYDQGPETAARFALKDFQEIEACELFVGLSEETDSTFGRGGRHVEFGYAMALMKTVCIIGPLENLFHYHFAVSVYDSADHFLEDYRGV